MKKQFLFTFLYTIVVSQLIAQDFSHEFGKCSKDELQMSQYAKDSIAEAVVIYDIGKSYFQIGEGGYKLIFEKTTKIKIFNKAGIDWAQIEIPYYEENGKAEDIVDIQGNTYNLENGVIRTSPLDIKNTFDEKRSNGWLIKKFAMPDVKEGSVIEVKYKLSTPYIFQFRSWEFQWKIPVIYSEYTTMMVPFCTYRYILQGTNKLYDLKQYSDVESKQLGGYTWRDKVYVFIMKDIPAFRDESFISAPDDYIIKVEFQLAEYINSLDSKQEIMTTWPKMIKELLNTPDFGDYVKSAQRQAKGIVDTMKLETKTPQEKAEKIFKYVKSNYSWNRWSSKYTSGSVKDFLRQKEGNCAEINLFLTGMLRASGVDANPVIISTRGNGKIKYDYPFVKFFNYVIVAVAIDGQYILLDATEPLCNFGMLPTRCLNDVGLVVKKGEEPEWVNFSSVVLSSITYNFDLTPNVAKDSIEGKFKIISSGYDALKYRKSYISNRTEFNKDIVQDNLTLSDSVKVEYLSNTEKLFPVSFSAAKSIDQVDGKLLVSPFSGYVISDNPFKQPARAYPIDMTYKKRRTYMSTIHIPEGYKLFSVPENVTIDNDDMKITYKFDNINDQVVKVLGIYEFKRDVYKAATYLDLKKYYNTIIKKFNERVILVKK